MSETRTVEQLESELHALRQRVAAMDPQKIHPKNRDLLDATLENLNAAEMQLSALRVLEEQA